MILKDGNYYCHCGGDLIIEKLRGFINEHGKQVVHIVSTCKKCHESKYLEKFYRRAR